LAYLTADVAIVASDAVDHPLFFRTVLTECSRRTTLIAGRGAALLLQDTSSVRGCGQCTRRLSGPVNNGRRGELVGNVLLEAIRGADRFARNQFEERS